MAFFRFTRWFLLVGWALLPTWAGAAEPPAPAYALVVGNNAGGPGQDRLGFAEEDARRVAGVLRELARYDASRVHLLVGKGPAEVLRSLDALRQQLAADKASGAEPRVFFYYSGHARANAMNLGAETLDLTLLREKLLGLPSALTVVVLDACQSGAFSRTKGAGRAADFSWNSVDLLKTRGIAVMASSSEKELSQESEDLQSSYFTHHLIVGLRGAGDRNRDGRVSLDEAYGYAYAHTLASTSRTAVGGQHVVLETDLTGQGDVPLTFPAAADSRLHLTPELDGKFLLQIQASGSVMAELTKAKGAPLVIALPAGKYDATVRRGGKVFSCSLAVGGDVALDMGQCREIEDPAARAKGTREPTEIWGFDLAIGGGSTVDDRYLSRLDTFGFKDDGEEPTRWAVGASRTFFPHLAILVRAQLLESEGFVRSSGGRYAEVNALGDELFNYEAYGFTAGVRAFTPIMASPVTAYAQLELGPAVASSHMVADRETEYVDYTDTHWGYHARGAVGLQVFASSLLGFTGEMGYAYAPVVDNDIGDVHDSGGTTIFVGMHGRIEGFL